MNKIYLILLLIPFIVTCTGENVNVTIKGSFKEAHPPLIYLKELGKKGISVIDSTVIDKNGEFTLHAYTTQPSFYVIWVENSRGINVLALPGDKMKIYIHSNQFDIDYSVEGSPESRRISKLIRQQYKTLEQITELSNEFEKIRNSDDFVLQKAKLDTIYLDIFKKHKDFSEKFIYENQGSLVNLMALDQQLGRSAPVFDMNNDFRIFENVDSSLSAIYPTLEIVKSLNRKVIYAREQLKFEPGIQIPDISLPDTSGKVISLSSLRGNYVILAFWASWCSECRENSASIQKIVHKYSSNKLQVYQVSFDKTKDSWQAGMEEDKCTWLNVSDLKYLDSELINNFMLKEIPYYFLLDTEGRIIVKGDNISLIETKINEIL